MISELTLAIQAKIGLGTIGRTIHPYPTVAEAIQGCGVAYASRHVMPCPACYGSWHRRPSRAAASRTRHVMP